jgi:hypothetical protein
VAAVRNAIATEKQKRILRSNFNAVSDLALDNGTDKPIFDFFDGNNTLPVLEYSLRACENANARGCWISTADNTYTYRMPIPPNNVVFTLSNNRFTCDPNDATTGADCRKLTE